MNKKMRLLLVYVLCLIWTLSACSQPLTTKTYQAGAASLSMQVDATPAPPVEDASEIGSTEGIFIMGVVIVAITILPIFILRKKKQA